jgi:hypothetical protein
MIATVIQKYVVAFVALLVTNLLATVTATGFVFPHSVGGWISFVATTVGGTFAVWVKSNFKQGSV